MIRMPSIFFARSDGLSLTQLGILDSLMTCLAAGLKIRKDEVAKLYPDLPVADVEVVLKNFFEETSDGYVTSNETHVLRKAMFGLSTGVTDNLTSEKDSDGELQGEQKTTKGTNACSSLMNTSNPDRRKQTILKDGENGSANFIQKFKNKKEFKHNSKVSSHLSARAYARASESDYLISDTEQIGSDQLCKQAIELLVVKGFLRNMLLEVQETLKEVIERGMSLVKIDEVSDRVIKYKGKEYRNAINYLMTCLENELLVMMEEMKDAIVEDSSVTKFKNTEKEDTSKLEKFLKRGGHPFCIKISDFPSCQSLIEHKRDQWLLDGNPVRGLDAAGQPIHDKKLAEQMKYYGEDESRARIANHA